MEIRITIAMCGSITKMELEISFRSRFLRKDPVYAAEAPAPPAALGSFLGAATSTVVTNISIFDAVLVQLGNKTGATCRVLDSDYDGQTRFRNARTGLERIWPEVHRTTALFRTAKEPIYDRMRAGETKTLFHQLDAEDAWDATVAGRHADNRESGLVRHRTQLNIVDQALFFLLRTTSPSGTWDPLVKLELTVHDENYWVTKDSQAHQVWEGPRGLERFSNRFSQFSDFVSGGPSYGGGFYEGRYVPGPPRDFSVAYRNVRTPRFAPQPHSWSWRWAEERRFACGSNENVKLDYIKKIFSEERNGLIAQISTQARNSFGPSELRVLLKLLQNYAPDLRPTSTDEKKLAKWMEIVLELTVAGIEALDARFLTGSPHDGSRPAADTIVPVVQELLNEVLGVADFDEEEGGSRLFPDRLFPAFGEGRTKIFETLMNFARQKLLPGARSGSVFVSQYQSKTIQDVWKAIFSYVIRAQQELAKGLDEDVEEEDEDAQVCSFHGKNVFIL